MAGVIITHQEATAVHEAEETTVTIGVKVTVTVTITEIMIATQVAKQRSPNRPKGRIYRGNGGGNSLEDI